MDTIRLATCGAHVSIWALPEVAQAYEISSVNGKVTSASWNNDGTCLASCHSSRPDHISLTFVKNNAFTTTEVTGFTSKKTILRALQYPHTSQKCLYLAVSDSVVLYDLIKKKSRQTILNVPNVTSLGMSPSDKYIAAGNDEGNLYILNTMMAKHSFQQPFTMSLPDSECSIACTKFNNFKQAMVGACADNGLLAFWDINTAKELQKFCEHKAPATGLAFSPVNEALVLTSGLDKRCVCYDTSMRKPLSTICTDSPLTSVEFAPDGTNLVLGTSKGSVYLYDLRSFSTPTAVFHPQTSAVTSVLFQPGGDRANVSALLSSMSKASISSSSNQGGKSRLHMKENLRPDDTSNISLGSQVFSPLRDSNLSGFGFSPSNNALAVTPNALHISHSSRFSSESVLSPLRDTSLNMASPVSSFSAVKKFSTPSGLTSILEESNKSLEDHSKMSAEKNDVPVKINLESATPSSTEYSDKKSLMESVVLSASTPFYIPKETIEENDGEEEKVETAEASKNVSTDEVRAILTAFPQALESPASTSPRVEKSSKAKKPSVGTEIEEFRHEYVQAAVEEAMDEFCSDMRKQLWHWHYDMIKAFQQQNQEIRALMAENNVNEALLQEVKKLREENAQLKNTPFLAHFDKDSEDIVEK